MLLFIADLHLTPRQAGVVRIFLDFLASRARKAERLFILGDLFEVWPGDDVLDDPEDRFGATIADALHALTTNGVAVALLHGNRDFLLGKAFAARSGVELLNDPHLLSVPSWQFVLSHGDALCTDDREYQELRRHTRQGEWQAAFLAKPLAERKRFAAELRARSESAKRDKPRHLMDVSAAETDDFLRAHGYATLIHGHTHRPATHDHLVDGIHVERWVLSDWHDTCGECLCWDGERLWRESLR